MGCGPSQLTAHWLSSPAPRFKPLLSGTPTSCRVARKIWWSRLRPCELPTQAASWPKLASSSFALDHRPAPLRLSGTGDHQCHCPTAPLLSPGEQRSKCGARSCWQTVTVVCTTTSDRIFQRRPLARLPACQPACRPETVLEPPDGALCSSLCSSPRSPHAPLAMLCAVKRSWTA